MDNKTCRFCLCEYAGINIFEDRKNNVFNIVKRCFPIIDILENDGLPQIICLECWNILGVCDNFLTKCVESYKQLREQNKEFLQGGTIKVEPSKIEDENVGDIYYNDDYMDYSDLANDRVQIEIAIDDVKIQTCDTKEDIVIKSEENKSSNKRKKSNEATLKKSKSSRENVTKKRNAKKEKSSNIKRNRKTSGDDSNLKDECKICGKLIQKGSSYMKRHMQQEHQAGKKIVQSKKRRNKIHKCRTCGLVFQDAPSVRRHRKAKHSSISCDVCQESYRNKRDVWTHMLTMHLHSMADMKGSQATNKPVDILQQTEIINCDICGMPATITHIREHILLAHTHCKRFTCQICFTEFRLQSELNSHMKTHPLPYTCDMCQKKFRYKKNIRSHIENVHMEMKYSDKSKMILKRSKRELCQLCGKDVRDGGLKEHMSIHTTQRNFSCDICHKTFKLNSHMKKHVKLVHQAVTAKCDICNKILANKSSLQQHIMDNHVQKKVVNCDLCDKTFCSKYSMVNHRRLHTHERPYPCRYCDSTFTISTSRLDHERLHLGITPFQCPCCPKAFVQLSNMKSHFRNNHKGVDFNQVYKSRRMQYFNKIKVPNVADTPEYNVSEQLPISMGIMQSQIV